MMLKAAALFFALTPVAGVIRLQADYERSPGLSDCLLKIARQQVKTKKFVFLEEEVAEEQDGMDRIMRLNWQKVIVSASNISTVSGLYVFMPKANSSKSYEKILKTKEHDYRSMYIIYTDNYHNIYSFFEYSWAFKIIDVVALFPSTRTNFISVYTFFPFGEWGCSTTDPVRINIYEPFKNSFQIYGNVFSKHQKLSNFHRCPVRVTLKDNPSETLDRIDFTESLPSRLYNFLQKRLNFTPEATVIDKESNTYAAAYYNFTSAAVLNIVQDKSDMAIGEFSQLIDDHENTHAPVQTSMDCFTWAVPTKAGKAPSVWTTALYEFDVVTWILIILCYVVCALVMKVLSTLTGTKYSNPTMSLFGMMMNISVNMSMRPSALKVFTAHWLMFCLVVVAAYSASLGSLITVPPDSLNIKTTSELLEKEIALTGDPKMYHILSASSATSVEIKNVIDRFVILRPGEFDNIMYEIYTDRKTAVFFTKNSLIREENRVKKEKRLSHLVHIVPDCLIRSHTAPLIMRKGSMFQAPVKDVLMKLLESGLLNYWAHIDEEKAKTQVTVSKAQKITISQLRGALIVIITGYIISTVVFLYEIYSDKVKIKSSLLKRQPISSKETARTFVNMWKKKVIKFQTK